MSDIDRTESVTGSSIHVEYESTPPRPPNSWILYRSSKSSEVQGLYGRKLTQGEVSRLVSRMWKDESAAVKGKFQRAAEAAKKLHEQLYPGYHYCPRRDAATKKRALKKQRKNSKGALLDETAAGPSQPSPPSQLLAGSDASPAGTQVPPSSFQPPAGMGAGYTTQAPPLHFPFSIPQQYLPPGQNFNMALPQAPQMLPYLPEMYYSPYGPPPPMSTVSSPLALGSSVSSDLQLLLNMAALQSTLPSLSSESIPTSLHNPHIRQNIIS